MKRDRECASLAQLAVQAAEAVLARSSEGGVGEDELGVAVGVIDRGSGTWRSGSFRGDEPFYPASVVKSFYAAHLAHLVDRGEVELTEELERAATDMIVSSNNDATGLVLEALTGTTGGPELPPDELAEWMLKRQAVNRWFAGLGYTGMNACQKTWNEGPYGRERQGYGPKFEHRNSLTPHAALRFMAELALDRLESGSRGEWLRSLFRRASVADGESADSQSRVNVGKVLPAGWSLWSKAGWTDEVRHDAAWVATPDGREFVLVVFTRNHSKRSDVIPAVAQVLLAGLDREFPLQVP